MDTKDLYSVLQKHYEIEAADNADLFRRSSFIISAIVVLGTIGWAMTEGVWIRQLWPRLDVLFYAAVTLFVFAALVAAVVSLVCALYPRDWDYPIDPCGPAVEEWLKIPAREAAGSQPVAEQDPASAYERQQLQQLAAAIDGNRERNIVRFQWLQIALRWIVGALVLIGLQVLFHAIIPLVGST